MLPNRADPKRLVYITTSLGTGGAELMLYKLLSRLSRDQFNVVVVSLGEQGTVGALIENLGIPVYAVGMHSGVPSLLGIARLYNLLKRLHPDIIHGWMYH